MNRNGRFSFRGLTASVLLTALLVTVGGTGRSAAQTPARPPLPGAAKAILHFDLERLRKVPLFKEIEEQIGILSRSTDKLDVFLAATGLGEAAASLKGFTLYSFGTPTEPQSFAGVVSGGFAPETIQRLEKAYAPVARQAGGHVLMPVIETPEMILVMSFLGSGGLAFGTEEAVSTVVVGKDDSPSLAAAHSRIDARRPIWGVIDARQMIASLPAGGEGGQPLEIVRNSPALKALTSVGFSVELGRDVFFELRAFTEDAESAKLLADALKGMIALGQMGASQATNDADIAGFFRQMIAESERDSVYISFTLTEAQIEKLRAGRDLFADVIPK